MKPTNIYLQSSIPSVGKETRSSDLVMEGREPILNDQHPCRTTNTQATNSHTAQLSSDSSQGRLFMPSSSANLCMWNHQNVFRRSRSWAASFLIKSDEQAHATIIAGSFLRYSQVIQDSDSKISKFHSFNFPFVHLCKPCSSGTNFHVETRWNARKRISDPSLLESSLARSSWHPINVFSLSACR